MKLFNTKINLNFIKNSAKFLILAFLIIYCIYILYFSSLKTVESFESYNKTEDCSKCEVKPTSGNCIKIYDFSHQFINIDGDEKIDVSFVKIETGYIFCPWESNCDISNEYRDNMLNKDTRKGISNENLQNNMFGSLNNITCCSGSNFYKNQTLKYYETYDDFNSIFNITGKCNQFYTDLSNNNGVNLRLTQSEFGNLTDISKNAHNYVLNQPNYYKFINFCINHNINHPNYIAARSNIDDFNGILFKRDISDNGHILKDPKLRKSGLTRKTIIDNIISKQQLIDISDGAIKEENTLPKSSNNSFYGVIDRHNKRLNALKTENMSDRQFYQRLDIILNDLVNHYEQAQTTYSSNNQFYTFKYKPSKFNGNNIISLDNPIPNSNEYILNENEFLNCFGKIESSDLSMDFTVSGEYYGDYFGVSDPSLVTFGETTPFDSGPISDLSAEFRRLQNVPPGGNAPVGVINQYLNAINGFYERHISNMLGPKTHSANNQLVFENDNLEIKTPTFFKYETDPNNKYECQPSITGNDKFKDCGPTAYYTEFKP